MKYEGLQYDNDGKLIVPTALSSEDWDQYYTDLKKAHPLRFYTEELKDFYRYTVKRKLTDIKYYFIYRLHPSHRYHVVNTGLRPGYHDYDDLLLHASFQLLNKYFDHLAKSEYCYATEEDYVREIDNYTKDGEITAAEHLRSQYLAFLALKSLKDWWNNERQEQYDLVEKIDDAKEYSERYNELYLKDNEMLKKLIDLRQHLWV